MLDTYYPMCYNLFCWEVRIMTFLVYNHFTGFIFVTVNKGSKEKNYCYVNYIYGSHFIKVPDYFSKFA